MSSSAARNRPSYSLRRRARRAFGAAVVVCCAACTSPSDIDPEPEVALDEATPEPVLSEEARRALEAERSLDPTAARGLVASLCEEVGGKLGSVSVDDCRAGRLVATGRESLQGRALVRRDFTPEPGAEALGKVLVIGGIHGDEYSSVSILFRWLERLDLEYDGSLHWRLLPLTNPDGLLATEAQRMNRNGVDLNRNFPTVDWEVEALDHWQRRTGSNPRRYPGEAPLSEPESRFIHEQIHAFEPDLVVSVHAPLEVVDFDGEQQAPPDKLGSLYLRRLGTYPGSLGRYGNEQHDVSVLTLELARAGTMPTEEEQDEIWNDLLSYLLRTVGEGSRGGAVSGG